MADITKDQVIEWLSGLSVLDIAALVKEPEDKWGVSAAAPVAVVAGGAAAAPAEEKDAFDVILKSVEASKKISVIKEVRAVTSLGLADAKALVDGAPTAINQLAAVSVAEARILTIQPWDTSVCRAIEKAIQTSDIGINPQSDGKIIRMTFPPLTEDRRKELAKDISKMAEESKVAIRNIRREAMDKLKAKRRAGI